VVNPRGIDSVALFYSPLTMAVQRAVIHWPVVSVTPPTTGWVAKMEARASAMHPTTDWVTTWAAMASATLPTTDWVTKWEWASLMPPPTGWVASLVTDLVFQWVGVELTTHT
jgi:hypothetical protein